MPKKISLIGRTFERFKVIADGPPKIFADGSSRTTSICLCNCGNQFTATNNALLTENTKSCGCWNLHVAKTQHVTHGKSKSRIYYSWGAMVQRCTNPRDPAYENYGGRGIKVCERWMNAENFIVDMGDRPKGATIERIDNNGNYEPGNVRWATRTEQMRNTRRNRKFTFQGVTGTLNQLCETFHFDPRLAKSRIDEGWSIEDALTKPRMIQRIHPPEII